MREEVNAVLIKFANEVREIYGTNLAYVLLYGSYARGEAQEGSDLDVLVVLKHFDNFWQELSKLEEISYNLTFGSDHKIVLSAIPITQIQYSEGKSPFLLNVKKEEKIIE